MKKLLLTLIVAFVAFSAFSQKDPVSFSSSAVKKGNGVYEVTIVAHVQKPWHIYSQFTPSGGPEPTEIVFSKNPLVTLDGKAKEIGNLKTVYDKNFKTNVKFFDGNVKFVQKVKVKNNVKTSLTANVNYMVCDDNQCLPPTSKSVVIKLQ